MPAERAGYTVTMLLIDTSPSMATLRSVQLPPGPKGEKRTAEITNLEWALQFVKLKIQEMIYNGRKTDQCGVILFGSEDTKNVINAIHGGYDNVEEYLKIGQPKANTLAKIDDIKPSTVAGDPIDALIVGIETQDSYLGSKKTWTRKIILVTDGESPIEIEDWEATVRKMDSLDISLTVVGIDFDDPDFPFVEPNKTTIKRANEEFYATLTSSMKNGVLGTYALALRETTRPDIKQTRSTLMGTVLRLGDTETKEEEALEILVKTSKCTSISRPKSWKKFAVRENNDRDMVVDDDNEEQKVTFAQLKMRSEYFVDRTSGEDGEDEDVKMEDQDVRIEDEEVDGEVPKSGKEQYLEKVEKEELVRGFKYGTTYAPCPDGQFPRLPTKKGINICGFFSGKNFRRELSLGEIQYMWADPSSPQQQVALSSIVQAMYEKNAMAIARWVTKDDMDPKMGVLFPMIFDKVECFLWAQMPFADDVRKYTFASLDKLVTKKGEVITEHPYLPTQPQMEAMDDFVDGMDLMEAGEKDEEGNRQPWFDPLLSYNPALHRKKQAMFHCAIVSDIEKNPLPPPHPELLKYFDPPKRVLKRAQEAIDECKTAFKVKHVPKKVALVRKDGHEHAQDEDDSMLLLDRKRVAPESSKLHMHITQPPQSPTKPQSVADKEAAVDPNDSDTEEEDDEELLLDKKGSPTSKRGEGLLPTPARSLSPDVDPRREQGRIIGTTFPLKDFQKNIAQGDLVSKAVEDLSAVIAEVVMRPFAWKRSAEMLECMTVLRNTCLKEDEIDAWNIFIEDLKKKCYSAFGNPEFWSEVQKAGSDLTLIGKKEARKYGGITSVSDELAEKFMAPP